MLDGKHDCLGLLEPLNGDVAVWRGDDDAAVQRRAFTTNAQEHGRVAALLPERCVHVEGLIPEENIGGAARDADVLAVSSRERRGRGGGGGDAPHVRIARCEVIPVLREVRRGRPDAEGRRSNL